MSVSIHCKNVNITESISLHKVKFPYKKGHTQRSFIGSGQLEIASDNKQNLYLSISASLYKGHLWTIDHKQQSSSQMVQRSPVQNCLQVSLNICQQKTPACVRCVHNFCLALSWAAFAHISLGFSISLCKIYTILVIIRWK